MAVLRMNRVLAVLAVLLVGLSGGCQVIDDYDRMDIFNQSIRGDGAALRWGHENSIANYIRSPDGSRSGEFLSFNPNIRVSEYTIRTIEFSDDKTQALVTARLGYFETDSGVVRELADRQNWWYDEKSRGWYMDGAVPAVLLSPAQPGT